MKREAMSMRKTASHTPRERRANAPMSEAERKAFEALTRALEQRTTDGETRYELDAEKTTKRKEALDYVLHDEEFLAKADRGAVLRAMEEGVSHAMRNRFNGDGIDEKREEFEGWRRAHLKEYRLLKGAYAASASLWRTQAGKVAQPLIPTGKTLLHAHAFLQQAMEEFPALALDFPLDSPQAIRRSERSPLAPHQKRAKAALIRAGVPKDLIERLLFAVGLVPSLWTPKGDQ